jgi:phosphate transport system protein
VLHGVVSIGSVAITDLQRNIQHIDDRVHELFALIADGLAAATEALLASDRELAMKVIERDRKIDSIYEEVEGLLQDSLILQAPMTRDLRYLVSMLRIVPELERCGDLVEHIASRALRNLGGQLPPRVRGLIERMGEVGSELWRLVASVYDAPDNEAVNRLHLRDDEMDELHGVMMAEVVEAEVPLPVAMDMALVGRFYERLGDHAVNIANRLRFLQSGLGMVHKDEIGPSHG